MLANQTPSLFVKCWHFANADYLLLLMKQQIDDLVAQDQQLQAFLTWLSQKSSSVPAFDKPVVVRAFYLDLALARALTLVDGNTLDLARAFDRHLTCKLDRYLALDLALDRTLGLDQVVNLTLAPHLVFERVLERARNHARTLEPKLERTLQQLKEQSSDTGRDPEKFKQWWSAQGVSWTEQLRAAIIEYRHLGHNWQLSEKQREALKQYRDANLILVNCLNSYCDVTSTVCSEIEQRLLLPLAETHVATRPWASVMVAVMKCQLD